MVRHLFSKVALVIYLIVAIGLSLLAYNIYKDRNGKIVPNNPNESSSNNTNSNQSTENTDGLSIENTPQNTDDSAMNSTSPSLDDSIMNNAPQSNSTQKISSEVEVSGPTLAHITSEHCNNNCQAFASDLKLLEYCEQSCGISPIKNVSNCDDKKGIQKDYCLKDLAITKKDISLCENVKDANIEQSCKNHIEQALIEQMQRSRPNEEPTY